MFRIVKADHGENIYEVQAKSPTGWVWYKTAYSMVEAERLKAQYERGDFTGAEFQHDLRLFPTMLIVAPIITLLLMLVLIAIFNG